MFHDPNFIKWCVGIKNYTFVVRCMWIDCSTQYPMVAIDVCVVNIYIYIKIFHINQDMNVGHFVGFWYGQHKLVAQ